MDPQPNPPQFIDTHCHLDDAVFQDVIDEVISRSIEVGVTRWINVGFMPERWSSSVQLSETWPGMRHMLGLHPGEADQFSPELIADLRTAIRASNAVAIGEIGLDFYRGETNYEIQTEAFRQQLDLALELQLPVVIHMRAAEREVLDLLRSRSALPQLVFHSFDGTAELRDFVLETKSVIGVGGLMTKSRSAELREIIRGVPLEQMILETDSPYLSPAKSRGRYNQPMNVRVIATALAALLERDLESIATVTTANAQRIFGPWESA